MNRKAFFFSLITFLLLFSIVIFSVSYINRSKALQKTLADARTGDRMAYVQDDISAQDLYGLTGIGNCTISRSNSTDSLKFTAGTLRKETSHSSVAAQFARFVEDNYSALSNIQIDLINFSSGFLIAPYNTRYLINSFSATLSTQDYPRLRKISLMLYTNETRSQLVGNSTPASNGDRYVQVVMYDSSGQPLLSVNSANLDPNVTNAPFYANFSQGRYVSVQYGLLDGAPSTVVMTASGVSAELRVVELNYTSYNTTVLVSDGLLNVYSPIGMINKTSRIILMKS